MRWVRIIKPYGWLTPDERALVEWPVGEWPMKDEQADDAVARGFGEEIDRPEGKRTNAAGKVVKAEPAKAEPKDAVTDVH